MALSGVQEHPRAFPLGLMWTVAGISMLPSLLNAFSFSGLLGQPSDLLNSETARIHLLNFPRFLTVLSTVGATLLYVRFTRNVFSHLAGLTLLLSGCMALLNFIYMYHVVPRPERFLPWLHLSEQSSLALILMRFRPFPG